MVGLFGGGGFGGNFQSSGMSSTNTNVNDGCANILAKVDSVMTNIVDINCTLNKSSSTSSVATSANATVSLNVVQPPGYVDKLLAANKDITSQIMTLVAVNTGDWSKQTLINNTLKSLNDQIAQNQKLMVGTIDIIGSTIRVSANTRIRQLNQNTAQLASQVKNAVNNIVDAAANAKVTQNNGYSSNTSQIKSLISSQIQNQQQRIQSTIYETLTSTSISVNNGASIVLTTPQSIHIENSTLDASSVINIVTTNLAASGIQIGVDIANAVSAKIASADDVSQTNAGSAEALSVLKDAQSSAINSQMSTLGAIANPIAGLMSGLTSNLPLIGIVAGAGIGGVFLLKNVLSSSSSSSNSKKSGVLDNVSRMSTVVGTKLPLLTSVSNTIHS